MISHWSRADPLRKAVFVGLLGVIALIVTVMAVHAVNAEGPDRSAPPPVVVSEPPRNSASTSVTADPRSASPPPASLPSGPLTAEQLTTAYNRALSFVDVFANARWDEPAGARIAKIRPFVAPSALDQVLAQGQRVRPKQETRETCGFRVTSTRWVILTEQQASLIVDGIRTVESDGRSAEASFAFAITLSRVHSEWSVISARDPREGNTGAN